MDEKVGITRLWKECTVKIYEESWKDCENDDETRFLRVIETLDGENYYEGYYSKYGIYPNFVYLSSSLI